MPDLKVPHPAPLTEPFYFAIPRGATTEAVGTIPQHIAETYGVIGEATHVRTELAFSLWRITNPRRYA